MRSREHAPLPRRVLCVRLGAIGDVTNALVVATAIREAAPDTHIGWATHPLALPLVQGHSAIDRVHVIPRTRSIRQLGRQVQDLRRERYDTALDLQRLQKSALLARLSGARRVVGFDRARSKESSWVWTKERIKTGPKNEHMLRQYMRFPALLGLTTEGASPRRELPEDAEAVRFAERWVARTGSPILLNVGASKPQKRWPGSSFRALALDLERTGAGPIAIIGGPSDAPFARDIAEDLAVHNLAGQTSLSMVWELARRARLMVTGDTGAMHLCAAVGTPVVAIFGPGDPARTGPFGANHIVLRAGRRIPFRDGLAPESGSTFALMNETPVSDVHEAVRELRQEG